MNYRFADKRKTLALGGYPDVSLADANEKRDASRKKLAASIDPSDTGTHREIYDCDTRQYQRHHGATSPA